MLKAVHYLLGIPLSIICLLSIFSLLGKYLFKKKITKEITQLFNTPREGKVLIKESDLKQLPQCVQNWLHRSNVVGKEKITTVRLKQIGFLRMGEEKKWLPFTAEQYFSLKEPGFIWQVKVKAAPFITLTGRDKFYKNQGSMIIKLCSLFNIVNITSDKKELVQGAMLRYLAEIMWFPQAAVNNYVSWQYLNEKAAIATMTYLGQQVAAEFYFNDQGDIEKIKSQRYREVDKRYILTNWGGITQDWQTFNGIRIPHKGKVVWGLDDDNFDWFKFQITTIEYDIPQIY